VEGGVFVEAGEGVTFEVLDVEEGVHCIVCQSRSLLVYIDIYG
jgi:hypothetical protein